MPKAHKRKPGGQAGHSADSKTRDDCPDSTRIPPRTPAAIAQALTRLYRRCDDLADAGAVLSLSVAYYDVDGIPTGILIADRETAQTAFELMSAGVHCRTAGKAADA